jgi:hypothetical protein
MWTMAREEILNYWNGLRGSRPAPQRAELDPSALRHFLPDLFIVTSSPVGGLTFALAGTRICELFDRELRGTDYAELWSATSGNRPTEIVENVLAYERAALLDVALPGDAAAHPYDLLLLPLRAADDSSDRVLGAFMPRATPPSPLMMPIQSLTLRNWAFAEPDGTLPEITGDADMRRARPSTFLRRLIGQGMFAGVAR